MIQLLSIMAVGFLLGMRHATDPDHVIAVSTIVSRQPKLSRAALIGAFWGLGHTLTIFVVGTAIILFNVTIPTRLGLSMELSVGVMLVLLGLFNVFSFFRALPTVTTANGHTESVHFHDHSHGDYIHRHAHSHDPEAHSQGSGLQGSGSHGSHSHRSDQTPLAILDRLLGSSGWYQHLRPLAIGVVHGLAGSAAVALLVLATIRNTTSAIAYLLIFGVGTIAGMMVITMSLASAIKVVGRNEKFSRRLSMASGVLSVAFGCLVVYEIGFVNGLFSNHPLWTPR
jgi:ABC-type nickel/cobalt efflux system permease component RcnA